MVRVCDEGHAFRKSCRAWKYFTFTVPPNAFGWDLRLTNITSGDPYLTICRDRLPFDLGTHDYNGNGWATYWMEKRLV